MVTEGKDKLVTYRLPRAPTLVNVTAAVCVSVQICRPFESYSATVVQLTLIYDASAQGILNL